MLGLFVYRRVNGAWRYTANVELESQARKLLDDIESGYVADRLGNVVVAKNVPDQKEAVQVFLKRLRGE